METRVKNVVSSLDRDSDDVRMIGIKGMGGGGKTTLARAVFDLISIWFEGKSFVENVREVSKGSLSGLKELQKQIVRDVSNENNTNVTSVSDVKNLMKKIMCSRKVLVVLDDVDDIDQLEALAGELTWFKPGSRIIITTRDQQVLVAHRVNIIHDVNLLSDGEALTLFSRYAFNRDIPNQGYEELSRKVVHYAAGLPLTIKVLGSHLCGRIECEWVDAIERLKKIPLEKTLKRLEVSYNGLESDQKEIFLDVVCMLKGEKKDDAIRRLDSRGFNAQIGLRVLEQKSLITISDTLKYLGMHDHIEEMGLNIVRRLHPDESSRHRRLWIKKEIENILVTESGTEATRCIQLKYTDLHPAIIMKGLRKMKKLRFLEVRRSYRQWKVDEDGQHLPNSLQSLYWDEYPFQSLPKTFIANKLVNLEMPSSKISQLWEVGERKVLDKLKYLDLRKSDLKTFDFEMTPNLETLNLAKCADFAGFHMLNEWFKLKFLDLRYSSVSNLNLGMFPHLEELNLLGCSYFVELYMSGECPKLKYLKLSGSKVSKLNLGMTPHLEVLKLYGCYYLQQIQAPVGCLKKLVHLHLSRCGRFELFIIDKENVTPRLDSLASLQLTAESLHICELHPNNNFPKFEFECCYDEPLPSSSGNLERLLSFGLCACTDLDTFSASICGLQHLGMLTLEGNIPELPNDLYQLQSLVELTFSKMKKIKHLPDSICMLKNLKYLELRSCWELEHLPDNLGTLECLEKLCVIDCTSLLDIPNSICTMKSLINLDLQSSTYVEKLPEELGSLECLEELNIEGTCISRLPQSIFQMKGVYIYGSREQLKSCGFAFSKDVPKYTVGYYVKL